MEKEKLAIKRLAQKIRIHATQMTHNAKSSHLGSNFSIAEILAVLYSGILNINPSDPFAYDRDRFILSKGHASAGYYAVLSECGFISKEWLKSFYHNGARFSGHVSYGVPGIEISSGALGHGLSIGVGIAIAGGRDNGTHRVFVVLSDGECDEGSVWEAAMFAAQHRLSNLIAIIDYNKMQALGNTKDIVDLEPLNDKWRAFGWSVREADGHDIEDLFAKLSDVPFEPNKPNCLIAHTTKGKGVSFMENEVLWHYRNPQGEEFDQAMQELDDGTMMLLKG